MSSRWISMSLSRPSSPLRRPCAALTEACTALTSDDFPMPRAPHSSALLAGRPRAKRSVFSSSTSRIRSMPLSSDISTRLTLATGTSLRPSGCQEKASAAANCGAAGAPGASRSSAAATRSSACSEPGGAADIRGREAEIEGRFRARLAMVCGRVRGTLTGAPAELQDRRCGRPFRRCAATLQLGLWPL